LAFHLSQDQPVYGLLPRGLDGKGSYRTRIEDIAADYVEAIQAIQPEGPYHFVGYSFGGIVAFEVAHQILMRGGRVGLLGLFDTIEWQYTEKIDASLRPGQRLGVFGEHLKAIFSRDGARYFRVLLTAKFLEVKRRLLDVLGRPLSPTTGSIEECNLYAAANYRPKVYPGKLTIFRSTERTISDGTDEMLGWGSLAAEGVQVHHVPSNHFNMLSEPAVMVLAEKLRSCLGRDASGQ
jgi:thioesterase domain-containing protein